MQFSPILHSTLQTISETLIQSNTTLSVAESCTGGLLGAACTSLAGSSQWFNGGAIVYQNFLKEQLLGVPAEILSSYGAVSEECVVYMVEGCTTLFSSDYALAISGIAGPGGGSQEKPVGLVYIGVKTPTNSLVQKFHFAGSRLDVREQAMIEAFSLLLLHLDS